MLSSFTCPHCHSLKRLFLQIDPMARFSGDWEKEFRPQWELQKLKNGNGQVGGASDPRVKAVSINRM